MDVPWSMKCHDGVVKGLLRDAGRGWLPDDVLYRRKSPYPKTYDPAYEQLVRSHMREVLSDMNAPLNLLIDKKEDGTFYGAAIRLCPSLLRTADGRAAAARLFVTGELLAGALSD